MRKFGSLICRSDGHAHNGLGVVAFEHVLVFKASPAAATGKKDEMH